VIPRFAFRYLDDRALCAQILARHAAAHNRRLTYFGGY